MGLVKQKSPNNISLQLCGQYSGWCHISCFPSHFKFPTARKDFHPGTRLEFKTFSFKKQFMWGHNLSQA